MATLTADTDIVFIVDVSGSMGSYINKVQNALNNFADSLTAESVSFRLGLIEFESSAMAYEFTDNVETFKNNLGNLSIYGGTENGLNAIQTALSMDFREGVTKHFIMLTDEDYDDNNYSSSNLDSGTIISLLNNEGVVLDVVGSTYDGKDEYEPIANATGGNFYDISSLDYEQLLNDIVQEIIAQVDSITINLNDVGENETGVFVVNEIVTESGETTITSVATFKAAAEEGDIVVGNVTDPNVYVAVAESEYRQNITVPENWKATGTNNDDILRVTGNNATATGGAGADRFYVSSDVNNVAFADFSPNEDSLSFAATIPEQSLHQSMIENALALSNDDINLTFQNTPNLTAELLNTEVNNGGVTNTISELIEGGGRIVLNEEAPVTMAL